MPKYYPGAIISEYTVEQDGRKITVKAASRPEAEELAVRVCRMYQDAITVQDACNLSGVVRSFARHLETLYDMGVENTDDRNRHPISVLFSSKIASLTGSEVDSFATFHDAYQEVQSIIDKAIVT